MLTVTLKATEMLKEVLKKEGKEDHSLRIVVQEGCCGYAYGMFLEKEANPGDVIVEQDGIRIFIDPASVPMLKGSTIDYVAGLQNAGFTIENPNQPKREGSCGCGH